MQTLGSSVLGAKSLKEQGEHLLTLASILGYPRSQLRANHFRAAERALIHLRHFFTPERAAAAREWQSAAQAVTRLRARLARTEELGARKAELEAELNRLEAQVVVWRSLTAEQRATVRQAMTQIRSFLDSPVLASEAEIVARHELYHQLSSLVPYAEQVDHLCAAVKHYARRDEYESERKELESRIESARIRERSVRRGFILALCLGLLVVTLPLCVPFAFSLWNRLREIASQRAQLVESRRRVLRKLELASEGVIAAEDITAVLGERSLVDVRSVLEEVRRLHQEFTQPPEASPSLTRLLVMLDREGPLLDRVCGVPPDGHHTLLRERLASMVRTCDLRARQADELAGIAAAILRTADETKSLLKGYNPEILRDTIARLEDRMEMMEAGPVAQERDLYASYARLCRSMPRSMDAAQSVLSRVSYGQEVTESDWTKAGLAVVSASNTVGALVAALELAVGGGEQAVHKAPSERPAKLSALSRALILLVCVAGAWLARGPSNTAHANPEVWPTETPAALYYADNRLDISGVSKVKAKNQSGLDVEMEARRNGVDALATQLKRVCKESSLAPDWKQAVRSEGSEIFADRTFRIMLSGRISSIIGALRSLAVVPVTAQDGRPIVFTLSQSIPLELTQCGALELVVPSVAKIRVFPTPSEDSSESAVVALKFEQAKAALVPRDQQSAGVLETSSLVTAATKEPGRVIRLPVQAP